MKQSSTPKKCDICNAEEEKLCPIGGFDVHLEAVYMAGSKKLVCQSCLHEHFTVAPSDTDLGDKTKNTLPQKIFGLMPGYAKLHQLMANRID